MCAAVAASWNAGSALAEHDIDALCMNAGDRGAAALQRGSARLTLQLPPPAASILGSPCASPACNLSGIRSWRCYTSNTPAGSPRPRPNRIQILKRKRCCTCYSVPIFPWGCSRHVRDALCCWWLWREFRSRCCQRQCWCVIIQSVCPSLSSQSFDRGHGRPLTRAQGCPASATLVPGWPTPPRHTCSRALARTDCINFIHPSFVVKIHGLWKHCFCKGVNRCGPRSSQHCHLCILRCPAPQP